ncbi:heterogeneous nuclear ribonucleoprotein F-like [Babylonia areolata]|uniref:heterogeneous nuclear ribonucleoprotein F-like n=1 Tax=Babylonia areolata TaxID=304850 RepID=UPI003FD12546
MDGCVVRLRGLPWSTTTDDVANFFEGCAIVGDKGGIHLTQTREGRSTGEAFVEFVSEDDVAKALEKNNQHLGSRYIEVFRSKKSEMDWVVKRSGGSEQTNVGDACVKLRGLPFGCSKEEIAQFFTGLEIVPNGIMLPEDRLGRSTGEAFVQFASQAIAERAMGKHKERIGHRYIEIFKSCMAEANAVTFRDRGFRSMGRPGPYDRGDRFGGSPMGMGFNRGRGGRNVKGFYGEDCDSFNGGGYGFGGGRGGGGGRFGMMGSGGMNRTGHWVRMRGLPFQADERDIFEFFTPLQPVRANIEFTENGRPSGEANVEFHSHHDALNAMKKHRSNMQHRYIELFLNSSDDQSFGNPGMGGGFGGGNMGNTMGSGGFGSGNMSSGFNSGMGDRSSMGGFQGQDGGQYGGNSGQYGSNGMGSSGYMSGSSGQGSSFGNQGYSMGGGGGGYSSMGSSTMTSLANPSYTAF